jgi:hypothetical protein
MGELMEMAVNRMIDYYIRQELLTAPLPDLKKSGTVNIHILHGQVITAVGAEEDRQKREAFLQIAVPDSELSEYRRIYNVRDLLQFYVQRDSEPKPEVRVADRAMPKIKKKA